MTNGIILKSSKESWEEIFATLMTEKELASKIYKEFI